MKKLEGKVAVVTGGSSGIGFAVATKFIEEGAHVYITGRRQSELDKAARALGRNVTPVQGDVSNLGDLDRLYETVRSSERRIDIIVANASIVELVTLAQATPEHFDRIFDVNARGAFFTVQKALPLLNDGGSVVLVSSGANTKGIPAYTTYSATKAAQRSFARSWAAELKDRGIRVNSVSPGPIDTAIFDAQAPTKEGADALREEFRKMVPLGRIGKPEEIANAVLFLASNDSSYSTGIDLVADGGLTQL